MAQTANISLQIKRVIKAPRDRVYAAWTDPVQLKQWFGPENIQTQDLIADARAGGKFRWDLRNAEGEKMTCRGEYRELQPGKKIAFTWQWDDDEDWENHISLVTVELEDCDGGDRAALDPRATAERRIMQRAHTRLEQCPRQTGETIQQVIPNKGGK